MKILVDEDAQAHRQLTELRVAGHDVLSVGESGNNGLQDPEVLDLAIAQGRALLTKNGADFERLTAPLEIYPGILAIYQESDTSKNMTYQQVALAVTKLEGSGMQIANQFHVLNQWR